MFKEILHIYTYRYADIHIRSLNVMFLYLDGSSELIRSLHSVVMASGLSHVQEEKNNTTSYKEIVEKLSDRIKNNKITLQEVMVCMDLLFVSKKQSSQLTVTLIEHLATHNKYFQSNISPSIFIQLLFYLSIFRDSNPILMAALESYLDSTLRQYDIQELGLICHSFFSMNHKIRSYDIMSSISKSLMNNLGKVNIQMLCNIFKALHHGHYDDLNFFMRIGDALCHWKPLLNGSNLTSLCHIARAYSAACVVHPKLFQVPLIKSIVF